MTLHALRVLWRERGLGMRWDRRRYHQGEEKSGDGLATTFGGAEHQHCRNVVLRQQPAYQLAQRARAVCGAEAVKHSTIAGLNLAINYHVLRDALLCNTLLHALCVQIQCCV